MAVVRDYVIAEGPAKGARVFVMDDCFRGISAAELARRRGEVGRIIRRIDIDAQTRGESYEQADQVAGAGDRAGGAGDRGAADR